VDGKESLRKIRRLVSNPIDHAKVASVYENFPRARVTIMPALFAPTKSSDSGPFFRIIAELGKKAVHGS
jgi:hypothetical protein